MSTVVNGKTYHSPEAGHQASPRAHCVRDCSQTSNHALKLHWADVIAPLQVEEALCHYFNKAIWSGYRHKGNIYMVNIYICN